MDLTELADELERRKKLLKAVDKIEGKPSMISRRSRAFGFHLILASQRPDANTLSGQIKNTVNCRICGRSDTILSQIILDSTTAAEQILKNAQGRFILHNGIVFQSY